jgi:hypothetical protein
MYTYGIGSLLKLWIVDNGLEYMRFIYLVFKHYTCPFFFVDFGMELCYDES